MPQRINEQVAVVAAVESETHFFEVGGKMLCANAMPRTHDAALQERERGFNGIGVDITVNVLPFAVVNHFVVCAPGLLHGDGMRRKLIGQDYVYVLGDIFFNVLGERAGLGIFGVEEAEIAVAFADTNNDVLVVHAADSTLAAIDSADVGFVHFDSTVEHRFIGGGHCSADSMAEIPCCFVSADAKRALNLASGHTLLRFAEQERRSEPLHKRQVGVIEDSSSGYGELVVTLFAVVENLVGFQFGGIGITSWATRAFGPTQTGKKLAALFVIGKHRVYVN